jgi:hypothetical protein
MDAESFTTLALRVIAGEATAEERRALEAELSRDEISSQRRDEFVRLRDAYEISRIAAPMAAATSVTEPQLPAHRVNELRTAVRQHFGPAANRDKEAAPLITWGYALRWLSAGTGFAIVGVAVLLFCFANRTIEVGLYGSDLARDGEKALSQQDLPAAKLVTFDQDATFDAWENRPLGWSEHARIWVDNEHDLLHIIRRIKHGQVITETQPLAPTLEGQRDQIKDLVEVLQTK